MGEVKLGDMGHLMKNPVQNAQCPRCVTVPKYKKRKVSAVRDFPPHCGRSVQALLLKPVDATAASVGADENIVGVDGTHGVLKELGDRVDSHSKESLSNGPVIDGVERLGNEVSQSKEKQCGVLETDNATRLGNKADVQSKENICNALVIDSAKNLGNVVNLQSVEKTCDASKTNAGASVNGISSLSNSKICTVLRTLRNEFNSESRENALDVSEFDGAKSLQNQADSQVKDQISDVLDIDAVAKRMGKEVDRATPESMKSLVPVDIPGPSSYLESQEEKAVVLSNMNDKNDGEDVISVECLAMEVPLPPNDERLVEALPDSEYKTPKLLKDAQEEELFNSEKRNDILDVKDVSECEDPPGDMLVSSPKFQSPPKLPSVAANVRNAPRNYPPRRNVFAVRDFPPLCGSNAPHLAKADHSSASRSGQECASQSEHGNTKLKQENVKAQEDASKPSQLGKFNSPDSDFHKVNREGNSDVGASENSGKQIIVHSKEKSLKRKLSMVSGSETQLEQVDPSSPGFSSDKVVVQGLMAAPVCPWRQGKGPRQVASASGASGSKVKKIGSIGDGNSKYSSKMKRTVSEGSGGRSSVNRSLSNMKVGDRHAHQVVHHGMEGSTGDNVEGQEDDGMLQTSRKCSINVPPLGVSSSSDGMRNKVRETLRLFQAICRKLLHEDEAKSKGGKNSIRRIDLLAAKIIKGKGRFVNTGKQIIGHVPGVEVGDEFHYRVELNIIGLHRQIQGGIDSLKEGDKVLASSIVASGGYADDLENSDTLIYTGQGGNVMQGGKEPEDQKLERGNLALKSSIYEKNPVRVIRGFKELKASEASDAKNKVVMTYTYDGLYSVEKYWQEMGQHGKLVYKFQLNRLPGQPELAWKAVKKTDKFKVREGLCVDDISQGKEVMPICAVNTMNDELPPRFTYITSMIYPSWYNPTLVGCNCIDRCSDSGRCSCAVKNGGEIPYNHNGAIVEAKPLVYECGPACRCRPSCHNRVSQHGIKFQLEVFKTESTGWGVRSLNSIPSGSFICEYIGELLEDKDAEQRTGNDEYLFDIGQNYSDHTLRDGLSSVMPDALSNPSQDVEDSGFTIDAAQFGNVGRFINHSCSPNLYAQNVLYDHEDKRMPHIMLFAAENIPPLQELTYHYNYTIGQVRDSDGNVRKKNCYCGSFECTGRMY